MKCHFIPLFILLFAATAVLSAGPFVRFGSGPLNASVQNENDAAIDRAGAWLVAAQSPEGFWGATNIKATAVCAIAVRGDREELLPEEKTSIDKAVKWLLSPTCTNILASAENKTEAAAWRSIALKVLADIDTPILFSPPLPDAEAPLAAYKTRWAVLEALMMRQPPKASEKIENRDPAIAFITETQTGAVSPARRRELSLALAGIGQESAALWLADPEAGWWLARAINRANNGRLTTPPDENGFVRDINWRGILAAKWINSQRIDSHGNGHWSEDAEKTAFAVLLLNEM